LRNSKFRESVAIGLSRAIAWCLLVSLRQFLECFFGQGMLVLIRMQKLCQPP